jgi:nitrogen fixation protein FixH
MSVMETSEGFRIKGWHVLAGMLAFFGVVTAVNVVFITRAYQTFPGQVSVTPYEDGVTYNRKLAQMSAQSKLGWRASAGVEDGQLTVRMVDKACAPIEGLKLTGRMERPATEAGKITPAFKEIAPGVYQARTAGLAGAWDLTFDASGAQGERFEGERRLSWP